MALIDITSDAVKAAVSEYDERGEEDFLSSYGFADAKAHWLVFNGRRYPSKAIAGVAHKYAMGSALIGASDFKGGEGTVVRKLRKLGFEVYSTPRNPDWTRDEIVLALDVYHRYSPTIPSKESRTVLELSALLSRLHRALGSEGDGTIRNANGVYLKLMNLRALDRQYTSQGKVGMQSGGKLEKAIWAEFEGHVDALILEADSVRQAIARLDASDGPLSGTEYEVEGEEGGVVMRLHKRRERDRKLVSEKKAWAKSRNCLRCEVCDFDYGAEYGALGDGFIEVHHIKPLHMIEGRVKSKLSDLALLCANCHRMAHTRRMPLTLEELREARREAGTLSNGG